MPRRKRLSLRKFFKQKEVSESQSGAKSRVSTPPEVQREIETEAKRAHLRSLGSLSEGHDFADKGGMYNTDPTG
ncbi:MAG: hypothetical protein ABIH20_02290, partial [Candidatus Diapherotrites archaeon]